MMDNLDHTQFGFNVEGFLVSRCIVDFAFTLDMLHGRRLASLRIEEPFECYVNGRKFKCDASNNREGLGPALLLSRRTVEAMWVAKDDTLHMTFSEGASLSVARDAHYESWTFNGPDGTLVVAGPGSDLTVFGPRDETG